MEHYTIRKTDLKQFEHKTQSKKGKPQYVYCSFTYITPNYSILLFLQELQKFAAKHDLKVIMVLWDMNVLANEYYRRMKKEVSDKEFIDKKIDELYKITLSLGFQEGSVSIYRSSDLWKRFISYKDEDIYQGFYSTLAQLRVEDYALSYKVVYYIQMPINLFFCNNFHKLYPEDLDEKLELFFFEVQREELYTRARKVMHELGITAHESPTFVIMDKVPYFNYDEYEPEWNMSLSDIHEIIVQIKPPIQDITGVCNFLDIPKPSATLPKPQVYAYTSKAIYDFLQERRGAFESLGLPSEERILSVSDKRDLLKIGAVLRSKIALDLLLEADGQKSISKIAKSLKKSIPTISTYIKKLKELNLLEILPNGNPRRLFKGFKANLDHGL